VIDLCEHEASFLFPKCEQAASRIILYFVATIISFQHVLANAPVNRTLSTLVMVVPETLVSGLIFCLVVQGLASA
jgi:hypothetical protein